MKKLSLLLLITLFITFSSACKKDDTTNENATTSIEVAINLQANGETIAPNVNQNSLDAQTYALTTFKTYLSNIVLVQSDDTEVPLSTVILYDFTAPQNITATVPTGTYKALKFGLGLDATLNASDPSDPNFDESHPLSYQRDTHWSWASKYKFAVIEGRAAAEADSKELGNSFFYHLGADELYREISLDQSIVLSETSSTLTLNIAVNQILKNIDLINENETHTNNNLPLAVEIIDNYATSFAL